MRLARHQDKVDESASGTSQTPTILLLKPPLERPRACLSSSAL
jgi:hypothetical protein